jgi:RNA 3'-terminal phosphate cyclase (ATP)
MIDAIHIDGAQGEGGGQIVRSALALAIVTGRPFVIDNVRARRKHPGLMPQHLAAVFAAKRVCNGEVHGAQLGSSSLRFEPRPVLGGDYSFDIGTAGSAMLVLQTVLPALLIAAAPSTLRIEGGTHNPWAPPFEFLEKAFLPLVCRMGPQVTMTLVRHGFYPAGGGFLNVAVQPSADLAGFDLLQRGLLRSCFTRAMVANLHPHIAEREVQTVLREMGWDASCGRVEEVNALGPGNIVTVELAFEQITELFCAFGRRGVRAEKVAEEVVQQVRSYLQADAPVGPHLADQLLLPLGISAWQSQDGARRRGGSFRTLPLTSHSLTHIEILRSFLDIRIDIEPSSDGQACQVGIGAARST